MAAPRPHRHIWRSLLSYGWYFLTAVTASTGKSTMFDELFHLTGGYTYWVRGDFRMQPENGNLPQRWEAFRCFFGI